MSGVIDAYAHCGYELCSDAELADGYEKIAIFERDNEPRHVARQLPTGKWTSKLGDQVDIEHHDVESVGGVLYGEPTVFLRRPVLSAAVDDAVGLIVLPGDR